ncbi:MULTISPECIES: bacteriocin immunity protein [Pseudomonas]|uniref:bacteriocin immunity protein n=1 Tax=Pseudomonas TaxID=286 RepID=UPI001D07E880|nr:MULTISPECIES: bacteriocin immunity protein [Pseudomonas]MCX4217120.1 bacteriocin immunity protein [Pseudomonas sp. MCal1]UIN52637.1 bacteriocin immunity protein [Pseudomonas kribbensis]
MGDTFLDVIHGDVQKTRKFKCMKLKPALNEYTETEFKALVDRIWAVDLAKVDHDRLINHFDQISGHAKGADLLFYPEDTSNPNSSESVVEYLKAWHHQQGRAIFKGQALANVASPPVTTNWAQQRLAQSLVDVQKMNAELAAAEQTAEASLVLLQQRIRQMRERQSAQLDLLEREADIRALEVAEADSRAAVARYGSWKMRIQFRRESAQRDVTFARSEQGQWQNIALQVSTTGDRFSARSNDLYQRLSVAQIEAESLLTTAQACLIEQRNQGVGSLRLPVNLFAPLAHANARPAIMLDGALSGSLEEHRIELQKSIRSVVADLTWQVSSGAEATRRQHAAVLQFDFSSRAEVGWYGVCVPLAEFLPLEGLDWQQLAVTAGTVAMPFRMSSGSYTVPAKTMHRGIREIKTLHQVTLASNQSLSHVRVRGALWNEHVRAYSFTTDEAGLLTVNWCPLETLETSPAPYDAREPRLGFLRSSPVPVLETISDSVTARFDDYVVVFPQGSGFEPLYVMFRNPAGIISAPVAPPETR